MWFRNLKIKKKNKTYALVFLTIVIGVSSPLFHESKSSTVGIKKDIAYAWMLTKYDSEITNNFKKDEYYSLPTGDAGVYEGMEFRWEIWEIKEERDNLTGYYRLNYAFCKGTQNITNARLSSACFSGYKAQIGKDPEFVGSKLLKAKSNYSFTLMFITQDVEGYLEGILRGLPLSLQNRFTVKNRTLIYEYTVSEGTYEMMIEYNEHGIQKNFSLTFNGKPFYNYYYVGSYTETSQISPFISILTFLGIIGIIFVISIGYKIFERVKRKKRIPKLEVSDLPFVMSNCPYCGKKIRLKLNFCPECGKKLK
jgi:hypothetical protein